MLWCFYHVSYCVEEVTFFHYITHIPCTNFLHLCIIVKFPSITSYRYGALFCLLIVYRILPGVTIYGMAFPIVIV